LLLDASPPARRQPLLRHASLRQPLLPPGSHLTRSATVPAPNRHRQALARCDSAAAPMSDTASATTSETTMPSTSADPAADRSTARSRRGWLLALLVLLVAVAAGLVWYLGRDTPAAVDTQAAIDAATSGDAAAADAAAATDAEAATDADPATEVTGDEDEAGEEASAGAADAAAEQDEEAATIPADDLSGRYRVDRDAVAYDFDGGTGTFVGFRIDEELSTVGATTAVGRTPEVDATVVVDGTELVEAVVTADLTVLRTDISQRDNRVQGALDTATHPTTTFELTEPVDLGTIPPPGEPVSVTANGELTLHGITRPVTVLLDAVVLSGVSALLVTGSFEIDLADHEIVAPSAPIVVSVADTGTVELQLYLAPA
jgi:polyisoprenoid-binding protein YceI